MTHSHSTAHHPLHASSFQLQLQLQLQLESGSCRPDLFMRFKFEGAALGSHAWGVKFFFLQSKCGCTCHSACETPAAWRKAPPCGHLTPRPVSGRSSGSLTSGMQSNLTLNTPFSTVQVRRPAGSERSSGHVPRGKVYVHLLYNRLCVYLCDPLLPRQPTSQPPKNSDAKNGKHCKQVERKGRRLLMNRTCNRKCNRTA